MANRCNRADINESVAVLRHFYTERDELHIEELRDRLTQVLKEFRMHQAVVMADLPPELFAHNLSDRGPEDFSLGLPSNLSVNERCKYGLAALADQEVRLREAQLHSTISSLKHTVNRLLSLLNYKDKNVDSEKLRTRTGKSIMKAIIARDIGIVAYNEYRQALISLQALKDSSSMYPHLAASDTFKKDVNHKRRVGDSKRREGILWTVGEAHKRLAETELGEDLPTGICGHAGKVELRTATQLTKRQRMSTYFFFLTASLRSSFCRTSSGQCTGQDVNRP